MDDDVRGLVEAEWEARLRLPRSVLRGGGVHVAADLGANDAMSFLFERTCIVAVPLDEIDGAREALEGLPVETAFTAETLRLLVGSDAQIDGPSWHSYANRRCFRGSADTDAHPVTGEDTSLLAFLESSDIAEWAEGGFPRDPTSADPATTRFWVTREGDGVVAVGTRASSGDCPLTWECSLTRCGGARGSLGDSWERWSPSRFLPSGSSAIARSDRMPLRWPSHVGSGSTPTDRTFELGVAHADRPISTARGSVLGRQNDECRRFQWHVRDSPKTTRPVGVSELPRSLASGQPLGIYGDLFGREPVVVGNLAQPLFGSSEGEAVAIRVPYDEVAHAVGS